jgi:hypothetical protein
VGVGQNPRPLPDVARSNLGRRDAIPFRIVPHLGQIPEYDIESSISEGA